MEDETEKIINDVILQTKCVHCSSPSLLVDIYLVSEEEFFSFKCSDKKCSKVFALDYNSYIYENWNTI